MTHDLRADEGLHTFYHSLVFTAILNGQTTQILMYLLVYIG